MRASGLLLLLSAGCAGQHVAIVSPYGPLVGCSRWDVERRMGAEFKWDSDDGKAAVYRAELPTLFGIGPWTVFLYEDRDTLQVSKLEFHLMSGSGGKKPSRREVRSFAKKQLKSLCKRYGNPLQYCTTVDGEKLRCFGPPVITDINLDEVLRWSLWAIWVDENRTLMVWYWAETRRDEFVVAYMPARVGLIFLGISQHSF